MLLGPLSHRGTHPIALGHRASVQVALAPIIVPGTIPIKAGTNPMRCTNTMGAALLCPLWLDGRSGHVDLGPRARVKGRSRPVQTPMRDAEALYLVGGTVGRRCVIIPACSPAHLLEPHIRPSPVRPVQKPPASPAYTWSLSYLSYLSYLGPSSLPWAGTWSSEPRLQPTTVAHTTATIPQVRRIVTPVDVACIS